MFNIPPRERFLYLKQQDFVGIEGVSIDCLIMEKAENVAMVEANFDWMDVGTWNAVLELSKRFDKTSVIPACDQKERAKFNSRK